MTKLESLIEQESKYDSKVLTMPLGKLMHDYWYYFDDNFVCTFPSYAYGGRSEKEYTAFKERVKKEFPGDFKTKKSAPKAKSKVPAIPNDDALKHIMGIVFKLTEQDFTIEEIKNRWND